MFRIFVSDSPLFPDYINFRIYDRPEFDGLKADSGKAAYDAVLFLIANMDTSSHENYLAWLSAWKDANRFLSDLNHHLKRNKYGTYKFDDIRHRTIAKIAQEHGHILYPSGDDLIGCLKIFENRRLETLAWTSAALTLLYNARQNGKLATAHIVTMQRIEKAGTSVGQRLYKLFTRAA